MSISLFRVLGLCSILFSLACGSKGDSAPSNPLIHPKGENESACEYKYDQGEPKQIYNDELKETFFNKVYGKHHLSAIAKSSGQETIKYMESVGAAKVYKADVSESGCGFHSALDLATEDFKKAWKEIDSGDGILLGLYFANNSPIVPGHEATIILRPVSDRWTSVHEFMHHLFESERTKLGVAQSAQFAAMKDNMTALGELNKKLRDATSEAEQLNLLQALINRFADHLNFVHHFLVATPLEEVTIETELMGLFSSFSYVPRNFRSALAYVNFNSQKAKETLSQTIEQGSSVLNSISADKSGSARVNVSLLEKALNGLKSRLIEVDSVVSTANSLYKQGAEQNLMNVLMGRGLMPPTDNNFSPEATVIEKPACGYSDSLWQQVETFKFPDLNL